MDEFEVCVLFCCVNSFFFSKKRKKNGPEREKFVAFDRVSKTQQAAAKRRSLRCRNTSKQDKTDIAFFEREIFFPFKKRGEV
jgi:hypothetical protein